MGIACVTGATGVVGSWILRLLAKRGWQVRALTRNRNTTIEGVEIFYGDLSDIPMLEKFVTGSDAVFHCAAELHDENLMYQTNVNGTGNLLAAMTNKGISYLCHLSSVGVMGPHVSGIVVENMRCSPVGPYEETKLAAERMVQESTVCDKTVILRPTNIVDGSSPGITSLSGGGMANLARLFLKGAEGAHLVHAVDVAGAAIYFFSQSFDGMKCYIVSMDEEPHTVGQVCISLRKQNGIGSGFRYYLPWQIAYWIRSTFRGASLKGDVIFSSKLLMDSGFKFTHGVDAVICDIACNGVHK